MTTDLTKVITPFKVHYFVNNEIVNGVHDNISGNISNKICGDVSNIYGDVK